MYNINKHRFRNFCIGMSLACCFALWAFNIEHVPKENVINIVYTDNDQFVEIQSFIPPDEPKIVKELKTRKISDNKMFDNQMNLLIVPDFINITARYERQIFALTTSMSLQGLPKFIEPTPIEQHPDVKPKFPGGKEALQIFLESNVEYPESCVRYDLSGKVVIQFVVDEHGQISKAMVIKDELGCLAAEEALRVVKAMPRWTPGTKYGLPVKSYFMQVFRFEMY